MAPIMARITVEDCLSKIDSQYDLVLLAKERASQLNAGEKSLVPENNDKNTVVALREIGESKISIKTIEDSAINKLRKIKDEPTDLEDIEVDQEDDFDRIYKGEISKSGAAILPSKRIRRIPEKVSVDAEDHQVEEINKEESLLSLAKETSEIDAEKKTPETTENKETPEIAKDKAE
jgi:DNA-directed RNA polymerase subunit omega